MESVFNLTIVCIIIRHLVRLVWVKLAISVFSFVLTLILGIILVVDLVLSLLISSFLLLFDLAATASLNHQHLTF